VTVLRLSSFDRLLHIIRCSDEPILYGHNHIASNDAKVLSLGIDLD
jgi:hypothetical protein